VPDIRSLFDQTWDTREGFKATCPRCGKKGKLFFNLSKNCGCCFEANCSWNPKCGGVTAQQLMRFLGRYVDLDLPPVVTLPTADGAVTLPEGYVPIVGIEPSGLREALFAYLESRGVSSKLASKVGIGYCTEGPLWGYLVFPVLEGGELVYWQARRFKNREPKFRNPTLSRKTDWLYVLGRSKHPTHAVVVESIFNALTLGVPKHRWVVCAVLGKAMSDTQLVKLMEHRSIQEVTLALDDDAWREQVAIARRMSGYFHVVRLARLPAGEDLNALGQERAWQAVFAAGVYQPEHHLEMLAAGSSLAL